MTSVAAVRPAAVSQRCEPWCDDAAAANGCACGGEPASWQQILAADPEPAEDSEPPAGEELQRLGLDPGDPAEDEELWLAEEPARAALEYFAAAQAEQAKSAGTQAQVAAAAAAVAGPGDLFMPGGLSRPGGRAGSGFAAGEVADDLAPGAALAGLADLAWARREQVSDDELIGITRAWRRLAAWAQARELAAVAELIARRDAQVTAGADPHIAEHVSDELAAALTLTGWAAGQLADFAAGMRGLPATQAALAQGTIDRARAHIIYEGTIGLDPAHTAAVETAVIGAAGRQTTGQLRQAVRRAVLAADPAAADRRREEAQKEARIEVWHEPAGTAALAGRDLPPADVLAADRRIDALARELRKAGAAGGLDALRARVYTALLLGIPVHEPGGASGRDGASGPGGASGRDGANGPGGASGRDRASRPGGAGGTAEQPGASPAAGPAWARSPVPGLPDLRLTGSVNLTMPLATLLGGQAPGEAAGFGPLPAVDARGLASLLATAPATRWCLTLTAADGTPLAHGCARAGSPAGLTFTVKPLAAGECQHEHEGAGYQPSEQLRHLITIRQPHCSYPGCRRATDRCDLDHTIAYDQGGRTCECGLAPLCRGHHRAKQTQGWQLEQATPGHMTWTLPHGRSYRTGPGPYPADGP